MRYRDRVKTAIALILSLHIEIFHLILWQGIRALSIDKDNAPKVSLSLSLSLSLLFAHVLDSNFTYMTSLYCLRA